MDGEIEQRPEQGQLWSVWTMGSHRDLKEWELQAAGTVSMGKGGRGGGPGGLVTPCSLIWGPSVHMCTL